LSEFNLSPRETAKTIADRKNTSYLANFDAMVDLLVHGT